MAEMIARLRGMDERALVLFHNRWADARGWIRTSVAFAEKREPRWKDLAV